MNLKMCTVGDLLKVIQEKYCLHETKQIFEDIENVDSLFKSFELSQILIV